MSDLVSALKAAEERNAKHWPWQTCRVCHVLSVLPEDEATALRASLDGNVITNIELSEIIQNVCGYDVSYLTVSRHRRWMCKRTL